MQKSKQITEIIAKDDKALYAELVLLGKKMNELEFKNSFKNLKNFHEITATRKNIARIHTEINKRLNEKILKEMTQ